MNTAYILIAFLSTWISIEVLFYTSLRLAVSDTSQTNYNAFIWSIRSFGLILLVASFITIRLSNTFEFNDLVFICSF